MPVPGPDPGPATEGASGDAPFALAPRLPNRVIDRAIVVDGLAGARAVAEAARRTGRVATLIPAAGPAAGPGWWLALCDRIADDVPAAQLHPVYDAGPLTGLVMAALRVGLRSVLYTGRGPQDAALDRLAAASDATLYRRLGTCLRLDTKRDPVAACIRWLCPSSLQSAEACSIPNAQNPGLRGSGSRQGERP